MKLQTLGLAAITVLLAACGSMGKLGALAGAPTTTEVELTVGSICPACSAETHAAVNPFTEPVKYTKVSDAEIDTFVESANKVYGSVLVSEKLIEISKKAAAGEQVQGFKDEKEPLSLAKSLFESASKDAPALISSGAGLVTSAPTKFLGPKALVLPTVTEQLNLAIERLNIAQGKLTDMAGSFGGGDVEQAPEQANP
ncbi:MAG: hypothetical protein KC549_17785 [Myxococcales bacterium]|nr:hypothetical protein [Myxococcales bacterium]MCB9549259.1 hypothetical protein [Myxococcales bacterium]